MGADHYYERIKGKYKCTKIDAFDNYNLPIDIMVEMELIVENRITGRSALKVLMIEDKSERKIAAIVKREAVNQPHSKQMGRPVVICLHNI